MGQTLSETSFLPANRSLVVCQLFDLLKLEQSLFRDSVTLNIFIADVS